MGGISYFQIGGVAKWGIGKTAGDEQKVEDVQISLARLVCVLVSVLSN